MERTRTWLTLFLTLIHLTLASTVLAQRSPAGGKWLELDGNTSYPAQHSKSLDITDELTIEAWIYPHRFPRPAPLTTRKAIIAAKLEAYELSLFTEQALKQVNPDLVLETTWGFDLTIFGKDGIPFSFMIIVDPRRYLNRWVHLAGTFDNRTDKLRVFIDGVMYQSTSGVKGVLSSASRLVVGGPLSNRDPEKTYFEGSIDELRISSRVYANDFKPPGRLDPDRETHALYHFEEAHPPFKDASGNGNTLGNGDDMAVMAQDRLITVWGQIKYHQ